MKNFFNKTKYYWLAILTAYIIGNLLLKFAPMMSKNINFIITLPIAFILMLITFINTKLMIIIILFTRALIDPVLNYTKIEIFGQDAGLGAFLNIFAVLTLLLLYHKKPYRIFKIPAIYSWIFFLSVCTIETIFSPYKGRALSLLLNLSSYMSFYLIAFHFTKTEKDKTFWTKILFLSTLPAVIFANIDLISGGHYYSDAGIRIKGTFSHPNILAFYLLFSLIVTLIQYKSHHLLPHKKLFYTIYITNIIILILFTKTRSAWIGLFLFLAIYGLIREKKYIIFLIIFLLILMFIPPAKKRITNIFDKKSFSRKEKLNSFSWRVELWKSSIPRIKKKFLMGNGLGSFRPTSKKFFPLAGKSGAAAHNIYIKLLFESGIAGLLSYISIFISILIALIKKNISRNQNFSYFSLIFPYIISYILIGSVDNLLDYLSFNWYFWFLCGVILADTKNKI